MSLNCLSQKRGPVHSGASRCGSKEARAVVTRDPKAAVEEWPTYGNYPGSSRYSPLSEITKRNVRKLKVAWTYRTGDVSDSTGTWNGQKASAKSTFEATPLIALDPET